MEIPIYKLFLGRPKETWYDLSEKERGDLQNQMDNAPKTVGGKK
jgi:hypothetical protein